MNDNCNINLDSLPSFLSIHGHRLFIRKQPRRHRTQTEHTEEAQKTSWTSSERLMYVQFTSCVYGEKNLFEESPLSNR